MNKIELKQRTKKFAIEIVKFSNRIPLSKPGNVICNQILRSGTSVGANYRAACRTRSVADFISKITIVEEEADETLFWLELLVESELMKMDKQIQSLMKEADELVAIFVASSKTAKLNNPKSKFRNSKQ